MGFDAGDRLAKTLAVAAVTFSPLWFIQVPGVNVGPVDFLLVAAGAVYVLDGRKWPLFPSRETAIGVLVFLTGIGISVGVSPVPVESLLDFFQYLLIFVVAVPVVVATLRDPRWRVVAILSLWVVLNGITTVAFWEGLSVPLNRMNYLKLWYGNQNNLYWVVSAASIFNLSMILEARTPGWIRGVSAGFLAPAVYLVAVGVSFSAWLMALTATWIATVIYIRKRHAEHADALLAVLLCVTVVFGVLSLVLVRRYWEFFYVVGNLGKRAFMYQEALRVGIQHLPFGTGLDSAEVVMDHFPDDIARSIHNFALSYFLEAGVLGVTGILVVFGYWLRDVLVTNVSDVADVRFLELAPMLGFAGYLVVIQFQNVPVHRFWWILFALSWTTVLRD